MVPAPVVDEDLELLVSYTRDTGEAMSNAIVDAFLASDVDVYEDRTPLESWVDTDALEDLDWSTGNTTIYTHIWDHPVVLTPDEVRIYVPPSSQ